MSTAQTILLTGATGLLGRYLLRDLLVAGHPVAVLARDAPGRPAAERLAELLSFWDEALGRALPRPVVLSGDLTAPHLGLGLAEQHWLARHGRAVIHAAAQVSYQLTPAGEPRETNVHGTRRLLDLCRALGLAEFHHLSTAFVCGDRRGVVREDELDCGGGSDNAYEQSKFAGEQLVRRYPGIRATVYRPSVVVGDSRTGYTSTYHHFYRFLELAVRLSARPPAPGVPLGDRPRRRRVPVRLPLTGEETQNLVPVDWVAQALVELVRRPQWHDRTFHLVARQPVRLREIAAIVQALLGLEGVQWAGREGLADPTPLESLVLEQFRDYWSYLHSDLIFDCRNTRQALPDLLPPPFDRALAARLLHFAQADGWGRARGQRPAPVSDCAHYLERVLPEQVRHSPLAPAIPRGLLFALDIGGAGGGQWSCRGGDGALEVRPGLDGEAAVTYRTDSHTFDALVRGLQKPQEAFFAGRITLEGDLEKALKLAVLIEQFLPQPPNRSPQPPEVFHAAAGS
jgi:thioester reductase-like protein